jgi:pSer/pThr/pTyr-binding forkhead associated (FHA) protein
MGLGAFMETEDFYRPSGLFLEQARPLSSRHWPLDGDVLAIGRDPSSTICINDTSISRHHADLIRRGPSWFIVDARSTNGTFVNDQPVSESIVQASDRVRVGRVEFLVRGPAHGPGSGQAKTVTSEAVRPPVGGNPAKQAEPAAAGMNVRDWHAGVIYGSDHMEFNYLIQQRENFLREVAATKTKARWLAWTGFVTFLAGFGLFAYADLSFIKQISNSFQAGQEPSTISPFGRNIAGVPIGLIGWAVGVLGMVLLIVGIVLHIVAASRRKRADRHFPVPGSWQGARP